MADPGTPADYAGMPMHATTVRFSPDLWRQLESEAARDGVSAAQFVRDATLLRLGALAAMRDEDAADDPVGALAQLVRRREQPGLPGPLRDPRRLAAVRATGLLDAPGGPPLRRLAQLACRILGAPVSAISLIDDHRQVVLELGGTLEGETLPLEIDISCTYCRHMLFDATPLVVPDARLDPRLRDSPALERFNAVSYLGVPLLDADDLMLGSLCVIDHQPRVWMAEHVELLQGLAASVMTEIELRAARIAR